LTGDQGKEARAPWAEAIGLLFAASLVFTLVLALLSFPVGAYTAFFTTLTPGVGPATPLPLYFWLGPLPVLLPVMPPFGVVFAAMAAVYLLLFAVAARRGTGFARALADGARGRLGAFLSSDLSVAMVSIGFLTSTATAVDAFTEAAGGQIGALRGSDATIFISTATSPLVEELGFRVCIIGLVAVILCLGAQRRSLLGALWRPASAYEDRDVRSGEEAVILVALVASSVAFGLAHVASGSGWEIGKLPEAAFGGLVLGYLYIRYGLHIAVLTHWGVDYLGSVYSFFGEGTQGIPWGSEPGYVLQQWVTYDLVYGIGLLGFLLVAYLGARRVLRLGGQGKSSLA